MYILIHAQHLQQLGWKSFRIIKGLLTIKIDVPQNGLYNLVIEPVKTLKEIETIKSLNFNMF